MNFKPKFEKKKDSDGTSTVKKYDPINNLEKLRDCKVFMVSGGADFVVPATTNENLLKSYEERFGSQEQLSLKIYPDAKHQITEEMWRDVLAFISKI